MNFIGAAMRGAARAIGGGEPLRYDVQLFQALAQMRTWRDEDVILDVGANDGRTVLRLREHLPAKPRILAFEPVAATYETLKARTGELEGVETHRLGLSAEAGPRTIYLHDHAALNSFDPAWGGTQGAETVETVTLDGFLEGRGIDRIQLLKIDVEGHDLEVLRGAERTLAAGRVEAVQIEAGVGAPGKPQPSLEEIRCFLQPFGLYLYGIYNQCRGRPELADGEPCANEILVYCDAVFVACGSGG